MGKKEKSGKSVVSSKPIIQIQIKSAGVVVLIVLIGLGLAKNTIAKMAVEAGVKLATGLDLRMDSLKVGLIKTDLHIQNLRILNPKGFHDPVMLDMPEIYVDYRLSEIIRGKIYLDTVRLHLKEFTVVKNEAQEVNLDSLSVVKEGKEKSPKPKKKDSKPPHFQIDLFDLQIGRVVYKDYSKGGEPSVKTFNINLHEQFKNVTNPQALISIILLKVMMHTTIGRLVHIDLTNVTKKATQFAGDATAFAGAKLGEVSILAEKAAVNLSKKGAELSNKAKVAVGDLTRKFKIPFGD